MRYSPLLLDHLEHPRNVGILADATHCATSINAACGDRVDLMLKVVDNLVVAVAMQAYGCAPTLAAASLLTELIKDRKLIELRDLSADSLIEIFQGLPRGKRHAVDLAIDVLHRTINSPII